MPLTITLGEDDYPARTRGNDACRHPEHSEPRSLTRDDVPSEDEEDEWDAHWTCPQCGRTQWCDTALAIARSEGRVAGSRQENSLPEVLDALVGRLQDLTPQVRDTTEVIRQDTAPRVRPGSSMMYVVDDPTPTSTHSWDTTFRAQNWVSLGGVTRAEFRAPETPRSGG